MLRPASRAVLRSANVNLRAASNFGRSRLSSTTPPSQKSRSWTNRLLRLGLAGGAIYYYNTSSVFAEQNFFSLRPQSQGEHVDQQENSLNSLSSENKRPSTTTPTTSKHLSGAGTDTEIPLSSIDPDNGAFGPGSTSVEDLENEAGQEGAFNPETGEINWDCPCLGGMAHGPCGEEFKAAFSCFVYSTEEPKGMDCIEKFKGMQDCFRQHPDIYGSELEEEAVDEQLNEHIANNNDDTNTSSSAHNENDASSSTSPNISESTLITTSNPAAERDSPSIPSEKSTEAQQLVTNTESNQSQIQEKSADAFVGDHNHVPKA